jgi:hypothetical protein
LQAVFVPMVQHACDDFRLMWNEHRIKGPRTEQGHGGGIPSELFTDPVSSDLVLDDDAYNINPEEYGIEEPFRGDHDDDNMQETSLHVVDPLSGDTELLAVRSAYFERVPLDPNSDGVDDYLRYRMVCTELVAALQEFGSDTTSIDWEAFGTSLSPYTLSQTLRLRYQLAWLALVEI